MPEQIVIKSRRGLSSAWASVNPILAAGEPGFETNTYKLKIGDGTTPWNDLKYMSFDGGDLDQIGVDSTVLLNFDGVGSLLSPIKAMTGNSIIDSSPNGFPVTAYGNPTITSSSKYGAGALQLQSGQYLTIAHNSKLNMLNNPFTIEAWVYPNGSETNIIASKRISNEYYSGFIFEVSNLSPRFLASSTGSSWNIDLTSSEEINAGNWHHIAVCHIRGSWKLFVNGILRASQNASVSISSNLGALAIGAGAADGSQNTFNGIIDDFRLAGIDVYVANFSPPASALMPTNIVRAPANGYPSLLSRDHKFVSW